MSETVTNEPLPCPHGCGWSTSPAQGRYSRLHNRIMLDGHLALRRDDVCPPRLFSWQLDHAPAR